ncbi:hypothetical protein SY83_18740 [Paenibacillus swuensis]|uniref:Uncharacterized protein n=1 Tax=Paenibacillus swuensis TaxID=1178515 RepID=A0A172TLS5_9BACL|nr:hypothetical protein [Paenibacillus swuensis]ANE47991.1 hypothetical protein SY83_18740 [Paenibacillus swuensis]
MSFEPRSIKHSQNRSETERKRDQDEHSIEPRHKKHPSNKVRMANLYYNTLIVLFIILTGGLIFWEYSR